MHLKLSSLDPGTHSTALFQSSELATKPTLGRGQLPAEHFAGTAAQAAAMEVTLFLEPEPLIQVIVTAATAM